jgi:hypothetical protein
MLIEQFYTNTGEVFTDSLGNEFFVLSIDIETAPAVIDAPQLQQVNKLIPTDILHSSFIIGNPEIAQGHNVPCDGVETFVLIGSPFILQNHIIDGLSIETPLTVSAPGMKQRHNITPVVVSSGFPTIITPELGQDFKMAVSNVCTDTPEIQPATIEQTHLLYSDSVISLQPVIGQPFTPLVRMLTATGISSQSPIIEEPRADIRFAVKTPAPVIGKPVITQIHDIGGLSLNTQTPLVDELTVSIIVINETDGVACNPPVVDNPVVRQEHLLISANKFTPSIIVSIPNIKQVHELTCSDTITDTPHITVPFFQHIHITQTAKIETGAPDIPIPVINQICNFYTAPIQLDGYVDTPSLLSVHRLSFNNILIPNTAVGIPALNQKNVIHIANITTPVSLIRIPQLHSIHNISVDLSLNSPIVGVPSIEIYERLTSLSIAARAPTISRPILPGLGLYPATSMRTAYISETVRLVVLT